MYFQPVTDILHHLIPKVPSTMPLLIVLDGLDLLTPANKVSFFAEWLPQELPSHVRILLTTSTDSQAHKTLSVSLSKI